MAKLKKYLEELGYQNVRTYIASGNVLLESSKTAAEIAAEMQDVLPKKFKLDSEFIKVLVLTHAQLQAIVDDRPRGSGDEPGKYHSDVIFLMGVSAPQAIPIFNPRAGVDAIWPGDGVIYSQRLSTQRTKSRLGLMAMSPFYKSMTMRSWNTTLKLAAMLKVEDNAFRRRRKECYATWPYHNHFLCPKRVMLIFMTRFNHQPIDNFNIRPLGPDENSAVRTLQEQIWSDHPRLAPDEAARRVDILSGVVPSERRLVATAGDELIGMASYFPKETSLEEEADIAASLERLGRTAGAVGGTLRHAHIFELGVSPRYRGRGVAVELATAALEKIDEEGLTTHTFHLTRHSLDVLGQRHDLAPSVLESEYGIVQVRDAVEGLGDHPDLKRTLFLGDVGTSLAAVRNELSVQV